MGDILYSTPNYSGEITECNCNVIPILVTYEKGEKCLKYKYFFFEWGVKSFQRTYTVQDPAETKVRVPGVAAVPG